VNGGLQTRSRPACLLCGREGAWLYRGLRDTLFGCPGAWGFRRCAAGDCGLVWADPAFSPEERERVYARYHTHGRPALAALQALYALLRGATPLHWVRAKRERMFVPEGRPGRVLDVGCGDGARLEILRARGWDVRGVDPDPRAVEAARRRLGDRVTEGGLEDAPFAPGSFDVVLLEHVLEHVEDPVDLLRRCRGLLRPGGRLSAVTPNVEGLGHRTFKAAWRGLEPPRHLTLFGPKSLEAAARRAGFRRPELRSTAANAWSFGFGSGGGGALRRGFRATFFLAEAALSAGRWPHSGEELVLLARAGVQ